MHTTKFILHSFFLINIFEIEITTEESEESLNKLIKFYEEDITENFKNEFTQFKEFVILNKNNNKFDLNLVSLYSWFQKTNLLEVFPLCNIALRLYLTLPISNCSAERSFSKMAQIKNKFRNTLAEENLNALTLLSSECDITRQLNFEKIIEEFAESKSRKKNITTPICSI